MTTEVEVRRDGPPEVIVALDFPDPDEALALVDALGDEASWYKVGLELFARTGPDFVRSLVDRGKDVFVDLKLYDIPNTVAGAVASVAASGASLLTLHASGGGPMLEAAVESAGASGGSLRLLGVTVLTSLSPTDVEASWGRTILSLRDEVVRLAELADEAGVDGVVASAFEAQWIRRRLGPEPLVVTPGIRLSGGDHHDQNRVATPAFAAQMGSDYLVVGRTITRAEDPVAGWNAVQTDLLSRVADTTADA